VNGDSAVLAAGLARRVSECGVSSQGVGLTIDNSQIAHGDTKMTKIEPLDDRIVVEPIEAEKVTKGGIVLPDTAKESRSRARSIATGPGRLLNTGKRGEPAVRRATSLLPEVRRLGSRDRR